MRRGGRGQRWLVAGCAVMALGAVSLSGCTSARDTLGTNSSPCFRALALAEDAVHGRGSFAGVRLVSAAQLDTVHHVDGVLKKRSTTPLHNLCLVSYRGRFRLDQVSRPAGRRPASGSGHFAIVVVSSPQNVLLATFVLEREPLRFEHLALAVPTAGPRAPGT
ncbi:MAG TPA: hypothetical protein VMV22_07195 [Acidimicrobiales bacterium]|nr:hypothetical protein [Acidimicrobiales bacterium]